MMNSQGDGSGSAKPGGARHSNPKHSNPASPQRRAVAPYNFVPLPQQVVVAAAPPPQDAYTGFTGWIDAELVTRSPLYIRGMLTEAEYATSGEKKADQLTVEEKLARAPFFSVDGERPVLPGSSLRGMVRSIVEIAGYGKLHWVADQPKVTYRAVAAAHDDPLAEPYRNLLGKFGRNVRAGYLRRLKGSGLWVVLPACHPRELGWPEQNAYLKVKQEVALAGALPGLLPMGDQDYRPGWCKVYFDAELRSGQRGAYVAVKDLGAAAAGQRYTGVLLWSGDMTETTREQAAAGYSSSSPRRNHALVLEARRGAAAIPVAERTIEDYRQSMTDFQHDVVWTNGFPEEDRPVFYVEQEGIVVALGHSPNFRIPDFAGGAQRAATPHDLVPPRLRDGQQLDLAEAIFGWTPEQDGKSSSCAGRVFFEDGRFQGATNDIWYNDAAITPQILGSPKPTTFQHYLVQDGQRGHSPDDRSSLAHYGTPRQETVIRGHKRYWFKGASPKIEAPGAPKEKQTTRIRPLRAGVRFRARVRFENLRPEELGALLWAVQLPGIEGKHYCHALGMGKPLGMGAIEVMNVALSITNRQARYRNLFDGRAGDKGEAAAEKSPACSWADSVSTETDSFVQQFEAFVLAQVAKDTTAVRLAQLDRIRQLQAMLLWRGEKPDDTWLEMTRYLEIERAVPGSRQGATVDEYKDDRVLPTPVGVVEAWMQARK